MLGVVDIKMSVYPKNLLQEIGIYAVGEIDTPKFEETLKELLGSRFSREFYILTQIYGEKRSRVSLGRELGVKEQI